MRLDTLIDTTKIDRQIEDAVTDNLCDYGSHVDIFDYVSESDIEVEIDDTLNDMIESYIKDKIADVVKEMCGGINI